MTVTTRGHCRESLSGCRDLLSDYCRAVGLCRALSEVTVGLSDRGSAPRSGPLLSLGYCDSLKTPRTSFVEGITRIIPVGVALRVRSPVPR